MAGARVGLYPQHPRKAERLRIALQCIKIDSNHPMANVASSYEQYRPYYKNECVDFVLEIAGLSKIEDATAACSRPCVLELGAGTGKFTDKFLERCKQDVHFIAVEPGPEFMEHLRQKQLPIEMIPSLAKDLKLANNSVDLVVAAQSFHWFANRESILEIHRVMKSGAKFVTLWNTRTDIAPWMKTLAEFVLERFTILNTPTQETYQWKDTFKESLDLFTPLQEKHMSLISIKLTLQEFVSYMMTISIFASQSESEKKESERELVAIASASPDLNDKGVIEIPFDTEIYWVSKI